MLRRGGAEPALTSIQHERRTLDRGRLSLLPASISKPTRTDIAKRALRTTTSIVSNVIGVSPHASSSSARALSETQTRRAANYCCHYCSTTFAPSSWTLDEGRQSSRCILFVLPTGERERERANRSRSAGRWEELSFRSLLVGNIKY